MTVENSNVTCFGTKGKLISIPNKQMKSDKTKLLLYSSTAVFLLQLFLAYFLTELRIHQQKTNNNIAEKQHEGK